MDYLKWMRIVTRYMNMRLDHELAALNINASQHMYIIKVVENPGMTQNEMIDILMINPSNVTRALRHLQKQGYITRTLSPDDKRRWCLFPTDKALLAYVEIMAICQTISDEMLSGLTADETEAFMGMLERMGQQVRAA